MTTLIVGLGAFYIGYRQWRTAHSKLKLDLYNKRYGIYNSATKYITALSKADGSNESLDECERCYYAFNECIAESIFLFRPSDRMETLLIDLFTACHRIYGPFKGLKSSGATDAAVRAMLERNRVQSMEAIHPLIRLLRAKMQSYLSFHNVDESGPWEFIKDYFWG